MLGRVDSFNDDRWIMKWSSSRSCRCINHNFSFISIFVHWFWSARSNHHSLAVIEKNEIEKKDIRDESSDAWSRSSSPKKNWFPFVACLDGPASLSLTARHHNPRQRQWSAAVVPLKTNNGNQKLTRHRRAHHPAWPGPESASEANKQTWGSRQATTKGKHQQLICGCIDEVRFFCCAVSQTEIFNIDTF